MPSARSVTTSFGSKSSGDRLRVRVHRTFERPFSFLAFASGELNGPQVDERLVLRGIPRDRGFIVRNGGIEILDPGQRVPAKDLRLGVVRFALQDVLRPRLGIVEASGQQQEVAGLQLRLDAIRQKVGGAHVLAQRVAGLIGVDIRVAQLQPGLGKARIDLK
jgi:hypothetical protein